MKYVSELLKLRQDEDRESACILRQYERREDGLSVDDRAWSVDYFRGALDAARQEVEEIEKALGLPEGVHITLWSRLDQWEMLLRQYEKAVCDLKERGVGDWR